MIGMMILSGEMMRVVMSRIGKKEKCEMKLSATFPRKTKACRLLLSRIQLSRWWRRKSSSIRVMGGLKGKPTTILAIMIVTIDLTETIPTNNLEMAIERMTTKIVRITTIATKEDIANTMRGIGIRIRRVRMFEEGREKAVIHHLNQLLKR